MLLNSVGESKPFTFHYIIPLPLFEQNFVKKEKEAYIGVVRILNQNIFTFLDDTNSTGNFKTYQSIQNIPETSYYITQNLYSKYGVADAFGNSIIPNNYSGIQYLNHGLFAVSNEKGISILNWNNFPLTSESYTSVQPFSDGLAEVVTRDLKRKFILSNGNLAFETDQKTIFGFNSGLIGIQKENKFGFMSRSGEIAIQHKFDEIRPFHQGVAPVAIKDSISNKMKWGLIDLQGKFKIKPQYDEIGFFKKGLAKTFINGKGSGFIDVNGNEIITSNHHVTGTNKIDDYFVFEQVICSTVGKENSLQTVDRNGKQKLDLSDYTGARFANHTFFTNTYYPYLLATTKDNFTYLLSLDGKILLKGSYNQIHIVSEDQALVQVNGKYKLISISTEEILIDSEEFSNLVNERFFYIDKTQSKPHIYTLEGKKVIPYGVNP